jgi:hypothetical protein
MASKSAMLVPLVLYRTVMAPSRFFVPVLDHAGVGPWLALWISQILSVSTLQWWLMPNVTRPFRTWLDPVDGAGLPISAIGTAVVIVGYGVTLAFSHRSGGRSSGTTPAETLSPRPRRHGLDRVGGMVGPAVAAQLGANGVESAADVGIIGDVDDPGPQFVS